MIVEAPQSEKGIHSVDARLYTVYCPPSTVFHDIDDHMPDLTPPGGERQKWDAAQQCICKIFKMKTALKLKITMIREYLGLVMLMFRFSVNESNSFFAFDHEKTNVSFFFTFAKLKY
jgi:hypothetical protein